MKAQAKTKKLESRKRKSRMVEQQSNQGTKGKSEKLKY
jgi:hypothetical protein